MGPRQFMPVCTQCQREFSTGSALHIHQSQSQVCEHAEEIRQRYRDGASLRMLAAEFDVDRKSVYRYLDSFDLVRDHSSANEIAWNKERFHGPDPDLTIDDEFAWLIGVLLGDGSVFKAASREYVIAMEVIDREFIDQFENALKGIGLSPSRYDTDYTMHVRAHSKKFYEWWNKQSKEDLIEIAEAHPASFVRGIYDSEGGIYYQTSGNCFNMTISITERWILELIKRLTQESIGHTFHGPSYYSGQGGVGSIRLHKRKQLRDFFDWINPTISRKGVQYMRENDRISSH